LSNEKRFEEVLESLKTIYENYWKKNNEINTSIKLPITISINSKEYNKIKKFENVLENNDLISNFYILRFDNQNTFYKIIYNSSPKTFLKDFNKEKFIISTENKIWVIK
jgi:hypothetical protein